MQGRMIFPLADELVRRKVPYVFSTGYDDSVVPARYSDVQRFSKSADDREIASVLLNSAQGAS